VSGRSYTPSAPWTLACPWCGWKLLVNARGAHNGDSGSGVEAAKLGQAHAEQKHGRTWHEFLAEAGKP
jgi:DNA-directed RNA polymerase subunit RPC12/RpoP